MAGLNSDPTPPELVHGIKNSLTILGLNIEILEREKDTLDERGRRSLEKIKQAASSISQSVAELSSKM